MDLLVAFCLGFLSKPVYPARSKGLSFQWDPRVESPLLSVVLCSLSVLGPAVVLILIAFWLQVQ